MSPSIPNGQGEAIVAGVVERASAARMLENTQKLTSVRSVIGKVATLPSEKASNLGTRSRAVLERWRDFHCLQAKMNRESGQLFNPLFLFDIGETKHSQILGHLLNPEASHGQGKLFLVSFLRLLGVSDPESGVWQISVESSRIDLLIRRQFPRSVVIVENKSHDAVDQRNQLYRYWHKAIHAPYPDLNYGSPEVADAFKLVYLPSGDHKQPETHSLSCPSEWRADPALPDRIPLPLSTMTFQRDVADWLAEVSMTIPGSNHRLKVFIDFYAELCRSL